MKNLVELSNLIRDGVLDALPKPESAKALEEKLEELLTEDALDDMFDVINLLFVEASELGYAAGFQTAQNLMQGKTKITIDLG